MGPRGLKRYIYGRMSQAERPVLAHERIWCAGSPAPATTVISQLTYLRAQRSRRDCLPMSVRHATDQPLAAWATAAKPHHFSIGRSLVDEHQTGRIKHALLSNPATARPSDICSFLLRRAQAFF